MLSLTRDLLRHTKDPSSNVEQTEVKPLTVALWSDFMNNPSLMYGLFSPDPRKLSYDPDKVKVMGTKDGMINQINVNCVEDLESFHEQIVGVPMLLRVWVAATRNNFIGAAQPSHSRVEGDLALLVDTSHPMIRPQLEQALDEARRILQSQQKFCVQIDFGKAIDDWLRSIYRRQCCSTFRVRGHDAFLYITNYGKPKRCLECNPLWCLFFGPCWLISAPCYKMFRHAKCRDIVVRISAPVVRRSILAVNGRVVEK